MTETKQNSLCYAVMQVFPFVIQISL